MKSSEDVHPVRVLLLEALGFIVVGAGILVWAVSKGSGPALVMGLFVFVGAASVAGYFVFAAWWYASGRVSSANIDPNVRRPRFWQRWPLWRQRNERT
jgi:hypothetical protein